MVLCKARAALALCGRARRCSLLPRKRTLTARKQLGAQLLLASVVLALCPIAKSQTVWDGPPTIFTKANGADWNLEANQDRITDVVWITRKTSAGIFNIAIEGGYSDKSPADTEWAYGSAADWRNLTFQTWVEWHGFCPPCTVGEDAVVHLVSEDIYIDITFLSWTCCGEGGGFSYERSTASICPEGGVCTVGPDEFNAFRGFHNSGDLDDVLESDDSDLCHDLGITIFPSEAPITLDFAGTLPNDSPATLDVTFESAANTPGLELTISFWNYNASSWEIVGTAAQGFNVDVVRTFAGVPADHVEAGTGSVRTRYEVRQTGIIFQFPWTDCIDQMFWSYE